MTQVLDEERVERACQCFHGSGWATYPDGMKDRCRETLRAAISAYLGETSGWQPIDTAPKDRPIMYHNGKMTDAIIGYCRWSDGMEETWWDYERDNEAYPKFWMPVIPLPSPPQPINAPNTEGK